VRECGGDGVHQEERLSIYNISTIYGMAAFAPTFPTTLAARHCRELDFRGAALTVFTIASLSVAHNEPPPGGEGPGDRQLDADGAGNALYIFAEMRLVSRVSAYGCCLSGFVRLAGKTRHWSDGKRNGSGS